VGGNAFLDEHNDYSYRVLVGGAYGLSKYNIVRDLVDSLTCIYVGGDLGIVVNGNVVSVRVIRHVVLLVFNLYLLDGWSRRGTDGTYPPWGYRYDDIPEVGVESFLFTL
jgi:hypothetical protein